MTFQMGHCTRGPSSDTGGMGILPMYDGHSDATGNPKTRTPGIGTSRLNCHPAGRARFRDYLDEDQPPPEWLPRRSLLARAAAAELASDHDQISAPVGACLQAIGCADVFLIACKQAPTQSRSLNSLRLSLDPARDPELVERASRLLQNRESPMDLIDS